MIVSANSASCTPAEPTTAGPNARKNLRTSASSSGQRNRVSTPVIPASPATSRNSRIPATSTPHAAAWPAVGKKAERQREHERQIQQDRSSGSGCETLQRIKNAAIERHQSDQQQVRESDSG